MKKLTIKNCPRCKEEFGKYDGIGALSRRDGKTKICSICGLREAITDYIERSVDEAVKIKLQNYR